MLKKICALCFAALLLMTCSGMSAFGADAPNSKLYQEGYLGPDGILPLVSLADSNTESAKDAIFTALKNREESVNVYAYRIPLSLKEDLFYSVVNEHPELFYVISINGFKYTYRGEYVGAYIFCDAEYSLYAYTDTVIAEKRAQIETEVRRILSTVTPDMTDVEKALVVHDWFCTHYSYQLAESDAPGSHPESHRIDGLFIDKTAVCQGYALGYEYVMSRLGIEAIYVPSVVMNHGWNMIKIGNRWYHVDVTYDDPLVNRTDMFGHAEHHNFLRSDAGITQTGHHDWESPYVGANTYENAFWSEIESGIFYLSGALYYVSGGNSQYIAKRARNTAGGYGNETHIYENKSKWYAPDGVHFYSNKFFDIGVYNGRIYYNTAEDIYSIKPNGSDCQKFMSPDIGNDSIVALVVDNENISYGLGLNKQAVFSVVSVSLLPMTAMRDGENVSVCFSKLPTQTNAYILIAFYDAEQKLAMLCRTPIQPDCLVYTVPLPRGITFVSAKAFAWAGCKSLCKSVPVQNAV